MTWRNDAAEVKRNKKDSQLLIRISTAEREQFMQLCEQLDVSAAREIRQFIRGFIKQNAPVERLTSKNNSCRRKPSSPPKKVVSLKQEIKKRAAKVEKHEKKIKALKKAAKKAA